MCVCERERVCVCGGVHGRCVCVQLCVCVRAMATLGLGMTHCYISSVSDMKAIDFQSVVCTYIVCTYRVAYMYIYIYKYIYIYI